jgi:hypothetical protein
MINSNELNKKRDIVFDAESLSQIKRAYLLLSGLPDCKVEYSDAPNTLRVSYNLRHYSLEGLENGLTGEGFQLDNSPLHNIGRKVIYYCGGCPEFCVNGISSLLRHPLLELDSKPI